MTEAECMDTHIRPLVAELVRRGIRIWSETGEEPDGWVNVLCKECGRIHEVSLDEIASDLPPAAPIGVSNFFGCLTSDETDAEFLASLDTEDPR